METTIDHQELSRWLESFRGGTAANRAMRRAALNLMEDTVAARRAAARDSIERIRAERSLRETEERLQAAVSATGLALFEWDLLNDSLVVNDHFRELFGVSPVGALRGSAVLAGVPMLNLISPRDEEADTEGRRFDFEWELTGRDRKPLILLITGRATFAPLGSSLQPVRLLGTALDITARKRIEVALRQAHDELEQRVQERTTELSEANASLTHELRERHAAEAQIKQLFRRLMTAQEDERNAIARDTHDQLGQHMTALRLNLEAVRVHASGESRLTELVSQAQELAEELDQNVDFLTAQLKPAMLDHLGLVAALESLVQDWSARFGTPASYEVSGCETLRLATEVELNLYRLVQEALHNIHKHSHANEVKVTLQRNEQELVVRVNDNGRGFEVGSASHMPGTLGLISMRERAALIGGALDIQSVPGRGTSVIVQVPLSQVENQPRLL